MHIRSNDCNLIIFGKLRENYGIFTFNNINHYDYEKRYFPMIQLTDS